MQVSLSAADYPTPVDVGAFFSTALDRIRALPGVVTATAMSGLPPLRTLATIGTYGVVSYSVAERRREIGIRMAMGAENASVLGMVLKQSGVLAGLGLVIGIAGSYGLSRFLTAQLYEVSATDPGAFVMAPLFLALVAVTACYFPPRRATRVDPVTALREE